MSNHGVISGVKNEQLTRWTLRLEKNAKWRELPMGVSVEGAVCVSRPTSNNATSASMFVVGGSAKTKEYQGLQRFIFATKTWETIIPSDPVTQNRVYHGAVYLNASDSILVYAGTQDGKEALSSQTFMIKASEPYQVSAYQSVAPPAISPMILPWSNSKAVYIGGSKTNQKVMFFDPATSWVDSNITLAQPIAHSEISKSVIAEEDESSKALYTFDLSVTPNTVNKTIISDPERGSLQNSSLLAEKTKEFSQRMEILSTKSLSILDDPMSPKSARNSYAASIDPSGLVVFSGGSDKETVSIFNIAKNRWEDTSKVFSIGGSTGIDREATSSSASSALSAPNRTDSPNSIEVTPQLSSSVLGAIIGSLLITAFFVTALLVFCRSRGKKPQQSVSKDSDPTDDIDEKEGMDFMDRGDVSELIEEKSLSSKTETSGKLSLFHKMPHKDVVTNDSQQIYKNAISKPIPLALGKGENMPSYFEEARAAPVPVENKGIRRSSGWNRYWSGENGSTVHGNNDFKSNPYMSDEYEDYSKLNRDSLTLGDPPDIYKVRSGSPAVAFNAEQVAFEGKIDGQRIITRPNSSYSSGIDNYSGYMYEPSPYGHR